MLHHATILIVSKNRSEELQKAVRSALNQSVKCEVIVIDDGSVDSTEADIRSKFSDVRYVRHEESQGYIVRRNQGVALASCSIVFSIDDDAALVSSQTVEQTLGEFDHPRIGAVAIPFVDIRKGPEVKQMAPSTNGIFVASSFTGTAHALRKSIFEELGGFRTYLHHQGEESDYCIRMLEYGFVVRLGSADEIHHFESINRNTYKLDLYGRRNDVLFCWYNVPSLALPFHLTATVFNGLKHGVHCRRLAVMVKGLLSGFAAIWPIRSERRAVSRRVFSLFRTLKAAPGIKLEDALIQLSLKASSCEAKIPC